MRAPTRRRSGDRRRATPLSRRFTYRYLIAIAAFGAIAIGAKVGEDRALDELRTNSQQLEAAAAQPARVYRILDLARRIDSLATTTTNAQAPQAEIKLLVSQLEQEVNTLRIVERALATGEAAPGLPAGAPSGSLEDLYFGTDTRLDQRVQEIANAGQFLADSSAPTPEAAAERTRQLSVLEKSVATTATDLDRAVRLYAAEADQIIEDRRRQSGALMFAAVGVVLAVVFGLFRPMARSIHLETSQLEEAERIHRENNERQTFRNDLMKALEVTETRAEVLATVERALVAVLPSNRAELLLADASQAHLRRVTQHPLRGAPQCPVDAPRSCAALRSSQRMVYESSRMLNVCPKLPEHSQAPCSAVCVPVSFNGQAMGVLHVIGPDNELPSQTQIDRLTVLATETGARLGHLQVMAMTELQANTDGLTGLLNRRSLEAKARSLILDGTPFSIAMADLDDFKELNDTHGHEAGDRALRLFATSLRRHLRPDDIAARFGGEEFVVLLPRTSIPEALQALNRVRAAIADELTRSSSPPFTTSWGLTDHSAGTTFEEMLSVADSALYRAKRAGKDCIVVDGDAARAVRTAGDGALSSAPSPGVPTGDGADDNHDLVELDLELLRDDEPFGRSS